MFNKRFLQRIEFVAFRQAFDGEDVFPFHPDGELAAGVHVAPIDDHRTGAALAAIAADLRSGKAQFIAQHFGQGTSVFDFEAIRFPVNFERNRRSIAARSGCFRRIGRRGIGLDQSRRNYSCADGAAADTFREMNAAIASSPSFRLPWQDTSCFGPIIDGMAKGYMEGRLLSMINCALPQVGKMANLRLNT